MTHCGVKEAARRIVESSCRDQGFEAQVGDPAIVGKIASILRIGSAAPGGSDAARVKAVEAADRRVDGDGVKDSGEHRAFAAQ